MTDDATLDRNVLRSAWAELEPLWIAGAALLIIAPGYQWGASVIRFFGRGGRTETVEWCVYLALLVGFPVLAAVVAYVLPSAGTRSLAAVAKKVLVVFLVGEAIVFAATSGGLGMLAACAMSAATVFLVTDRARIREAFGRDRKTLLAHYLALLFVGTSAWMSAGSLVSWTDATKWFIATPARIVVLVVTFWLTGRAFRSAPVATHKTTSETMLPRAVTAAGVIILVLLSFRTYPVLELYHWEAYVGPMQELRQGGWLLWDNPAQYGLLAILLPTLFPGNAWQSFYLFQGLCNVIVALLMFWAIRGVRPSAKRNVVATALTATTLFFRPRSATLLLAGQMTPSGGPVRFIWSFIMLAFVFIHYRRLAAEPNDGGRSSRHTRYAVWGNVIWLASILWSVEAAIYCSAVWIPAYWIALLQRFVRDKRADGNSSRAIRRLLVSVALPFVVLGALVVVNSAVYRVLLGHFPDWMSYFEYALLYGGGFRALPVDPTGSVWFLFMIFFAISTAAVVYLWRDPTDPRASVLAGAWGGVWAISSYFVSRSHPANLLSIATFLVFAAAITVSVLETEGWESWHNLFRVAVVPVFAVPIVLTIAHPAFIKEILTPQLSYGSFTEQIPLMEPSLNDLLVKAGAKPDDAIVRIGDGRLMLPAWRATGPGRTHLVSPYSWLPKQYEIIGTLPAARRQKYIDRMAAHLRLSGWLVHSKTGGIADYPQQIADISRTHVETKRYENKDWIVSWYQLKQ